MLTAGNSVQYQGDAALASHFVATTGVWPLVGRAEELDVVAAMLDGSEDDGGIVIAGHAGVGKTRLAREAGARAQSRGWAVRWVAGTVAAQPIPLGAFAQWATGTDTNPLRIVTDVIAAITASAGEPVLVVVDDAHLLDDLSAYVLHQLVVRRAASVILTVRGGVAVPDVITTLWKDAFLRRIDLQALSRAQSDALLEMVLGGPAEPSCATRMWHLTFGNVLFLRQLVIHEIDAQRIKAGAKGWQWAGPLTVTGSLLELIDRQIGAVPSAAGDVIDLVAIAEPLELEYLTQLADSAAIEYCEQHGLISVSPPGVSVPRARVGHPLYGEARRGRIGSMRLARLSGQLVTVMSDSQTPDALVDPVRVGRLWLQSDLPSDVGVMMRAAQVAYARHDIDLTSRFAEAAVLAGGGPEARLLLAHTLMHSATPGRGQEILDELALEPLPDVLGSAVGQLRAANLLWPLAQPDASWRVIDEALCGSLQQKSRALAFRAMQLAMAARPADAVLLGCSLDREDLGNMPSLMLTWALAIAWGDLGQPDEAVAAAELAATTLPWPSAALQAPAAMLVAIQALVLSGEIKRAEVLAGHADQHWRDVPGVFRSIAAATAAVAALGTGDVRAARTCLRRALAESTATGARVGIHYCFLLVYLEAASLIGDTDEIAEVSAMVDQYRHPTFVFLDPYARLCAAWASAAAGWQGRARAEAEGAAECARVSGQLAWEVRCRQTLVQFGDIQQASRLAELASEVHSPRVELAARWAAASASQNAAELSALSKEFEDIGDRICAADAAAQASVAYRAHQYRGAALTAAARASRLIAECGATTPATRTMATPLPLTNRQREIAELVAQGLMNKQIADELTLAVRTVEGNIYRACVKLGLKDRTALAQLMREVARPPVTSQS